MTCREFADFMADYATGELSSETHAQFEHHLSLCPNCRRYLVTYQQAVTLGARAFDEPDAALPPEVPEDLVQAILTARRTD